METMWVGGVVVLEVRGKRVQIDKTRHATMLDFPGNGWMENVLLGKKLIENGMELFVGRLG